ncbi:MAG: hypothetical protein A2V67_00100 [Deltaproteobacteria bacterium RBG_13_61_14]|nr:MAG: hypothetical protein A2V67_00100 [Deltaproteobacteria bacterium RBG_13_61_14]
MKARIALLVLLALGLSGQVFTPPAKEGSPAPNIQILRPQDTLKGLREVCVQVEEVEHSFEKLGVTRRKIKSEVKRQLEEAGIRVADAVDCLQPPFLPYVRIVLMGLPVEPSLFAAFLSLDLREPVTLTRKSAERGVAFASVWEKNMLLVLSPDKVPTLRTKVGELLDNFLDDYRKANPSQRRKRLSPSGPDNP